MVRRLGSFRENRWFGFLLGTANQRELRDVLVDEVQRDGVSSFALGVSIDNTHSEAGLHIVVRDLNISGDDVLPSVVLQHCSGFSGLSACGCNRLNVTFRTT